MFSDALKSEMLIKPGIFANFYFSAGGLEVDYFICFLFIHLEKSRARRIAWNIQGQALL